MDLEGELAKGLILNGYVTVTGVEDVTTEVATGRSSATDGSYALSIPASANFNEEFVRVVVTGGDGATMKCDAADGCANGSSIVPFGEAFPIGVDFELTSIIPAPEDGGSATVNVTALTHLVASLAIERAPATFTSEILASANSEVADLFGMTTSDFAALPVVDVTVADLPASTDAARSGFINAGLLAALYEDDTDLSVAMEDFVRTFISNDGAIVGNEANDDSELVSLEDIFEGSLAAETVSPISADELAGVRASLGDALATSSSRRADELVQGQPSPSADANHLDKAKAFVSDLQLVIGAAESDANGDSVIDFSEQVEVAAELLSDDTEAVFNGFASGAEAMSEALIEEKYAHDAGNSLTVYTSSLGPTVTMGRIGERVTANVQYTDSSGVLVSLQFDYTDSYGELAAQSVMSPLGTFATHISELSGSGNARLFGQASNSGFEMRVTDSQISVVDAESIVIERSANDISDVKEIRVTAESFQFDVVGEMNQKQSDGLSFKGETSFTINDFAVDGYDVFVGSSGNRVHFSEFVRDFTTSKISLSGILKNGEKFVDVSVVLDASADGLTISNERERVVMSNYVIANNEIAVDYPLSPDHSVGRYEFASVSEVNDLVAQYIAWPQSDGRIRYTDQDHDFVAMRDDDGSGRAYLMYTQTRLDEFGELETVKFMVQPGRFNAFFGGEATEEFLENPPYHDISAFYLGGYGEGTRSFVSCYPGRGGEMTKLYFVPDWRFRADGATIEGIVIGQGDCVSGVYYGVGNGSRLVGDGAVEGSFSASVRQNIAGIDANDPETEFSLFGGVNFQDETLAGDVAARVSFAGRRFEINVLSFDVLEEVEDQPISIINQDGVVMTLTKSSTTEEITGTLVLDGEELATIDDDNGVLIVRFADGTFVSLI